MDSIRCLVLLALVALSFQQNWYSGSTAGGNWGYAVTYSPISCYSGSYTQYQSFSVSVTSPQFYYITGLFEKDFRSDAQLQVYQGAFNSLYPCDNLLFAATATSYGAPHLEVIRYLQTGTYTFVVTSSNYVNGIFSVHVDQALMSGATISSQPYWYVPSTYYGFQCLDSYYTAPYVAFSFTQTTTGSFDLLLMGYYNTTSSWNFAAALYQGTPSFLNQGNASYPVSGCSPQFYYVRGTDYTDLDFDLLVSTGYEAAAITNVTLIGGSTYTIVMSTYDLSVLTANFGIYKQPSIIGNLGYSTFVTPSTPALSVSTTCVPSIDRYYSAVSFFSSNYVHLIDLASGFFDSSTALYSGINSPPQTCPSTFIMCGDTGDGGALTRVLAPGSSYTIVNYPYSGVGIAGAKYAMYVYTGTLIGSLPSNTGGTTGYSYSTYSYSTYSYTTYTTYTTYTGYSTGGFYSEDGNGLPSYLNTGAVIAGGVVGGVLLVAGIGAVIFVLVYKQKTAPVSPEI